VTQVSGGRCQWPLRSRETAIAYGKAMNLTVSFGNEEAGDRWTMRCRRNSRGIIRIRWRRARTCFSIQDARNLIRYGGMRTGPRTSSIRLRAVVWLGRVPGTLEILGEAAGGSTMPTVPRSATLQMSLNNRPPVLYSGQANESYPACSSRSGGFARRHPVENGYVGSGRMFRASGSRRSQISLRS